MIVLIMALVGLIVILFVLVLSNYYAQINLIRRFFRSPDPPKAADSVRVYRDVSYGSAYGNGIVDVFCPKERGAPAPLVIWIHGGGWVGGDKHDAAGWAHELAQNGLVTACINYELSPKQHYPTPLLQTGEALTYLLRTADVYGIDPTCVFLAGDSAGAQIAAQFAALATNASLRKQSNLLPPPAAQTLRGLVLCCGLYDMRTAAKSGFPAVKTFLWAYTDEKKFLRRYARLDELCVTRHITADYPPVWLTCGDADPFLGQATALIEALTAQGHTPEALLFHGKKLGHEYQFKLGTPDADESLRAAVDFIWRQARRTDVQTNDEDCAY